MSPACAETEVAAKGASRPVTMSVGPPVCAMPAVAVGPPRPQSGQAPPPRSAITVSRTEVYYGVTQRRPTAYSVGQGGPLASAPLSSSNLTSFSFPHSAAKPRGVRSNQLLGSAPFSSETANSSRLWEIARLISMYSLDSCTSAPFLRIRSSRRAFHCVLRVGTLWREGAR